MVEVIMGISTNFLLTILLPLKTKNILLMRLPTKITKITLYISERLFADEKALELIARTACASKIEVKKIATILGIDVNF